LIGLSDLLDTVHKGAESKMTRSKMTLRTDDSKLSAWHTVDKKQLS
jgi:hypothetical protein